MKTLLNRVPEFCRQTKLFLALAAAILLATPAFGQLHLSRERCLANIGGKPVHDKKGADLGQPVFDQVLVFHKGEYSIYFGFKNDKAVLMEIARLDGKQLSDGEIFKFLDFNAEDSKFVKKASQAATEGSTLWERADGKATAVSKEKSNKQTGRLEIWDHNSYPDR